MNTQTRKVFKKKKVVIGSVHFPPLLGYKDFPGLDVAHKTAKADINAFEKGGADAIIIENNYDLPHTEKVGAEILASMAELASRFKKDARKPMGVNVLWNDYEAAFSIAKVNDMSFIRIPVFVDTVLTDCGKIEGNPSYTRTFRKAIGAENILLFADIHVKHSKLLSKYSLEQSAKRALSFGADGLIVTGAWTGKPPAEEDLKRVRKAIGSRETLLVGSGSDKDNIAGILKYADGVIVSTSLKQGNENKREKNVKKWTQRISSAKVRAFIKATK